MLYYIYIILITFINQCHAQGQNEAINDKMLREKYGSVIFANLLYRHGDRTVALTYPNDPYKNSSLWKVGFKELTKEGETRHYNLGQWIRRHYPDLVGESYSPNNIYILSSDEDRCLLSAQSNLAGMYSVHNYSEPPLQPAPVHTTPRDKDNMLALGAPCPKLRLEKQKFQTSKLVIDFDLRHAALYKNLTLLTGAQINKLKKLSRLYDTLRIEHEDMELKLPPWTKSYYPQPLKNLSRESYLFKTHTETMKRLKAGPLITDMVNHLKLKAEGTLKPDRKLWIYSGHETTIVAFLHALNIPEHIIIQPSYATLVALELRRKEQEHFVTILYREGMDGNITQISMNGCDDACSLETFITLTKNMMVTNWEEECTVRNHTGQFHTNFYEINNISLGITEMWFFMVIILLCSPITCLICCQRRQQIPLAKSLKKNNEVAYL